MTLEAERRSTARESVPFRVRTADGDTVELAYSSPRPAAGHDEMALLETLPWFEPGKPLRNYMLHETDFYDEVEQIWGRRWGAEGIGTLREVLVSRPTENEVRPEYAEEWQYYYSSAAGTADLGRLQAQFDEYYAVLEDNGVRVNYIEPPVPAIGAYGWIKNLVTLAGGGLVVHGGAVLHRYASGRGSAGARSSGRRCWPRSRCRSTSRFTARASASRARAAGSTRTRSRSTSLWSRTRKACASSNSSSRTWASS
jgi:hypothetical protein